MLTLTKEQANAFALAVVVSEMLDKYSAPAITQRFCETVLPAVAVVPINPPGGDDVKGHRFDGGPKSVAPDENGMRAAVEFLKGSIKSETKAPITIAVIGEGHWTDADTARTKVLWTTFNDVTRGERLVVLERGMSSKAYRISVVKNQQPLVSEEQMMGDLPHGALASETCRTIIMAAFVFLCGRVGIRTSVPRS